MSRWSALGRWCWAGIAVVSIVALVQTGGPTAAGADTPTHGTGSLAPLVVIPADVSGINAAALPASVDLSTWAVTPGDQGQVGACSTWGVGRSLMGWYARKNGAAETLFAPMYIYSQTNGGRLSNPPVDGGGLTTDALNVAAYQGVDTAVHYTQGDFNWQDAPTAAERANAANYRITGYRALFQLSKSSNNALAVRNALAAGTPVVIEIPVRVGFGSLSPTNTLDTDTTTPGEGHVVLAVGYDANGLLVQNSWGTNWGTNGFGRIAWNVVDVDLRAGYVATGWGRGTAPAATTATATEINNTTVKVSGAVNIPAGTVPASVTVDYGPTTSYGTSFVTNFATGGAALAYSQTFSGLSPQNTYHYRVTVASPAGSATSGDRSFVTALVAGPPLITDYSAAPDSATSELTVGAVNLFTDNTGTATVRWGATSSYDHTLPPVSLVGVRHSDGSYNAVIRGLISGLNPGVYHYAVTVSTAHGSVGTADQVFIVPGPPQFTSVISLAGSDTGSQSVLAQANLLAESTATATVKYGTTASYGTAVPSRVDVSQLDDGSYLGVAGADFSGLTPGVTYHFAVTVTTAAGSTTSSDKTFVAAGPATVTAVDSAMTGTGVQWLSGEVGLSTTAAGTLSVRYGTTAAYGQTLPTSTLTGTKQADGTYRATFGRGISGLTPGLTYHYAITATNRYGSTSTADKTFVASGPPAFDSLGAAPANGPNTEMIIDTVNLFGLGTSVQTIRYGTTSSYGLSVGRTIDGKLQANGTYRFISASTLTGLTAGATYHYSVVVSTAAGTTTSADETFVAGS